MTTALPENIYPPGPLRDAYDRCLAFEWTSRILPEPQSQIRAMEARILGYMIREAPTAEGRNVISTELTVLVHVSVPMLMSPRERTDSFCCGGGQNTHRAHIKRHIDLKARAPAFSCFYCTSTIISDLIFG
jgi:hypothetical protein